MELLVTPSHRVHRSDEYMKTGAAKFNTRRTSIQSLEYDILWTIFWINLGSVDSEGQWKPSSSRYSPLQTLRYSSQVCQQWRQIILGSPILWGMVIDLNSLWFGNSKWAQKVVERTAQAKLYIFGFIRLTMYIKKRADWIYQFSISLLRDNWQRIRRLDIGMLFPDSLAREAWNFLLKPATELEIIRIDAARADNAFWNTTPSIKDLSIFAGTAMPHLREFCLEGTPSRPFSLDAPWLGQLHRLTLSNLDGLDLTEVPYALARLPLLEHLVLKLALPRDEWEQVVQEPILPRLRSLHITEYFSAAVYLLRYIGPSGGYSLSLDLQVPDQIMPSQETRDFCDSIKRYINNSFSCGCTFRSLLFEPGPRFFKVKGWDPTDYRSSRDSHRRVFSVSIKCERESTPDFPIPTVQELMASFSAHNFPHTKDFEFRPSGFLESRVMRNSLLSFFSCLHAVDSLEICDYDLGLLHDLHSWADNTFFPSLTTLQMRRRTWQPGSNVQLTFPVSKFLEDRIRAGKPITTLDISALYIRDECLDYDGVLPEWTHLDSEFPGLWVYVGYQGREYNCYDSEYECGTGAPQNLAFMGRRSKSESMPAITSGTIQGLSVTEDFFEDLMYYY